MLVKKINFNRPVISSVEIEKRQDFETTLKKYKSIQPNLFRKVFFYGSIGLSCIGGFVFLKTHSNTTISTKKKYENKNTLIEKTVTIESLKSYSKHNKLLPKDQLTKGNTFFKP